MYTFHDFITSRYEITLHKVNIPLKSINLVPSKFFLIFPDVCGVMVTVVGNGHGDTSSNPGRD